MHVLASRGLYAPITEESMYYGDDDDIAGVRRFKFEMKELKDLKDKKKKSK